MPNNYEKVRKAQEARENARAKQKAEQKAEEDRQNFIKTQMTEQKEKSREEYYQRTPFKNADIDRMNAQKKKLF